MLAIRVLAPYQHRQLNLTPRSPDMLAIRVLAPMSAFYPYTIQMSGYARDTGIGTIGAGSGSGVIGSPDMLAIRVLAQEGIL